MKTQQGKLNNSSCPTNLFQNRCDKSKVCSFISQRSWGLADPELVSQSYRNCSVTATVQEPCLFLPPPSHCHWFKYIDIPTLPPFLPHSPSPSLSLLPSPPPSTCPFSSTRIKVIRISVSPSHAEDSIMYNRSQQQLIAGEAIPILQHLQCVLFLAVTQYPSHNSLPRRNLSGFLCITCLLGNASIFTDIPSVVLRLKRRRRAGGIITVFQNKTGLGHTEGF